MLRRIQKKKEKMKKFWMGFVLVSLMIFSGLGILIGSRGGERWEYNEFKFKADYERNLYVTKINDQPMFFSYLPQTLISINVSGDIKTKMNAPMVYLTFYPEGAVQDLSYIDSIRRDYERILDSIVVNTMTSKSNIYNLPIMTCDNATQYIPVIYFNVANETSIVEENNCIIVNGRGNEFFQLRDLLLYIKYGVIE